MAKITDFDAGLVFSGKASGTKIRGYDAPTAYTPALDSQYSFNPTSGRDLVLWFLMEHPDPLWISGPTGCGKSSAVRQIAARLNYPVFEVNGHERLESSDLIGHLSVQHGSMCFVDGPLTLALRQGGLLLFNEIDLCSPATLAGLNTILDGAPLCIAENNGELVKPHPMCRFIATANSNGGSDDTGLYQGVLRLNLAFMDRFMLIEMGYPEADTEVSLLRQRFPQLPQELATSMVSYANDIRKQFMGTDSGPDALSVTLSTRTLLRWAGLTLAYHPLSAQGISPIIHALDRALASRASASDKAVLHELARKYFPASH